MFECEISVVVPVYGCPRAIPELYERTVYALDSIMKDSSHIVYEIILVDDRDDIGSWEQIKELALKDKRVKAIRFTRNCGQDYAIAAGIKASKGNWIITLDCDLQEPPEYIPELYKKVIDGGSDVVFARRKNRKAPVTTLVLSNMFHKIFSFFSNLDFDYDLGTYLIASRRAANYYCNANDIGKDFGMYLMWLGYEHDYVNIEHQERFGGVRVHII